MYYEPFILNVRGTPLPLSLGENKDYVLATVKPLRPGTNVTGFHYLRSQTTFLFVPGPDGPAAHTCIVIRNVPPARLAEYARSRFGFAFDLHCFDVEPVNPDPLTFSAGRARAIPEPGSTPPRRAR
jgi:hypothetical protein